MNAVGAAAIACMAVTACATAVAEAPGAAGIRQPQALIDWVRRHAVALRTVEWGGDDSDLGAVAALIGPQTRVVGFGEPVHGAREPLLMRNRLFAYLVEHCGVTAYTAETSFTSATKIDDYVTRGGELTEDIWRSVYIAAPVEPGERTEAAIRDPERDEDRQLLQWMREYNLRPTTRRPIRFYGIDICSKSGDGTGPCMRPAVLAALHYVATMDAAAAGTFERRLMPHLGFFDSQAQGGPSARPATAKSSAAADFARVERDAFTAALADLASLFAEQHVFWVRRTSALDFHRAYRNAVVAQKMDAWVRVNLVEPAPDDIWVNDMRKKDVRDSAMAENVLWALEREGPEGRLFLFAHDAHLDKAIPIMTGAHLRETLGDRYVVIGSTGLLAGDSEAAALNMASYRMTWLPSLTSLLGSVGPALLFLDMRAMPPLGTTPQERTPSRFRSHITPQWRVQSSYDAMIFTDSLSSMWRYRSERP